MPKYEFNIESGRIPATDWESLNDDERGAVYKSFQNSAQEKFLNPTFGSGNYETSASVLIPYTDQDGQSVRLQWSTIVDTPVYVPPDQLPPSLTSTEPAPSLATTGPNTPGTTVGPQPPAVNNNEDPTVPQQQDNIEAPPTTTTPTQVDPTTLEGFGVNEVGATPVTTDNPAPVIGQGVAYDYDGNLMPGYTLDEGNNPVFVGGGFVEPATQDQAAADRTQAFRTLAQQQQVLAAQKKTVNNGDWRVRLSLAPGARYLYNVDGDPGILQPLAVTGGVVFPYTPKIEVAYKADYESYSLTHSNYKGYFYKSSYADAVNMTATFTAQDTKEANYLLAVMHFFRSVTKMFYGQDQQRGTPPPLVYLTGLGQYQFAAHPCVVTSFNYNLPNDVDYIRARSTNINGSNMLTRRDRQDLPTNPISGAVSRLKNLFSSQGISFGAEICRPGPPILGQNQPTYVPTKLDIQLSLLPMQSRGQVTKQFSVRSYANGDLLKGGFW